LVLLFNVEESEAWKAEAATKKSWGEYFRLVGRHGGLFAYLVLLMAMMNFVSHGTQDLFPTFLQKQLHFNTKSTALISVVSMVGGIIGGTVVGFLSDRFGRRRAMVTAVLLGVLMIPLWVLSPTIALIAVGAFLIQFMVQGAWGVIPAHINELSPGPLRGFLPGFAYQCGVLIAASAPYIEARMTHHFTYGQSMGMFAGVVFVVASIVIGFGPEAHSISFMPAKPSTSP